jgi:hypothetical protein
VNVYADVAVIATRLKQMFRNLVKVLAVVMIIKHLQSLGAFLLKSIVILMSVHADFVRLLCCLKPEL